MPPPARTPSLPPESSKAAYEAEKHAFQHAELTGQEEANRKTKDITGNSGYSSRRPSMQPFFPFIDRSFHDWPEVFQCIRCCVPCADQRGAVVGDT